MRDHTFVIDEPADLAGVDTAPNAVEYVLSALGACLTVGFILNATKNGVEVKDFEIALDGKINNILNFLGLSKEGHPGYEEINVRFYVRAEAEPEKIEKIVEETIATSPVGNTLARSVKIIPSVSVVK